MKNNNIPIIIKKEKPVREREFVTYAKTEEDSGFFIEIWKVYDKRNDIWLYEAWIGHEDYGVKSLMFGCPDYQQSLEAFKMIVLCNADEYVEYFEEEYMD